jgi:excisionase family DNA binding protein
MSKIIRVGEAAARLKISQETLREWVRRGYLPESRTPSGQLLFSELHIEEIESGGRPVRDANASPHGPTPQASLPPRLPSWKEMPPWKAAVEATRASIELDALESEREALQARRDQVCIEREQEQRNKAELDAHRSRVERLTSRVLRLFPFQERHKVRGRQAMSAFATTGNLPASLSDSEIFAALVGHRTTTVNAFRRSERKPHDSPWRASTPLLTPTLGPSARSMDEGTQIGAPEKVPVQAPPSLSPPCSVAARPLAQTLRERLIAGFENR